MAKNRIDQSSLSINERQDFMTGVMKSFNGSEYLSARQQAMNAESDWVHSADDLYSFAIQHASKIIVNKGKISTASDTLREQFNRKLTGSEGLLDKYLIRRVLAFLMRTWARTSSLVIEIHCLISGKETECSRQLFWFWL
jgi:hypothetical protein